MITQDSIMATLGGPETVQVFFHDITSLPEIGQVGQRLPGFDRYDERALLLARPHDIVIAHGPVDEDYLQFLCSLGIGPQSDRIVPSVDNVSQLVRANDRVVLNPYMVTPREIQMAAAVRAQLAGRPDIVRRANQKHLVHTKARELGVPVAPGEVVELKCASDVAPVLAAARKYLSVTGRVIIRGTEGTSSSAQLIVTTEPGDWEDELRCLPANPAYLVHVMLPVTISPNIQFHLNPATPTCVSISDQRLDDQFVHRGNICPSSAHTLPAMIESARKLNRWLMSEGYAGLVGYDFCEYTDPTTGEPAHFLAEINPRVNSATYPRALMERLNAPAYLTASQPTTARSFRQLRERLGDLLFDRATRCGVVPYNTGCLAAGKCHLIVLGDTRSGVEALFAASAALV